MPRPDPRLHRLRKFLWTRLRWISVARGAETAFLAQMTSPAVMSFADVIHRLSNLVR
jgi:hypothetical protein